VNYMRADGSSLTGGGAPLALQTNGTPNGSQTLLNLAAGSNITLTDNGTGTVTVANTAPTPTWIVFTSGALTTTSTTAVALTNGTETMQITAVANAVYEFKLVLKIDVQDNAGSGVRVSFEFPSGNLMHQLYSKSTATTAVSHAANLTGTSPVEININYCNQLSANNFVIVTGTFMCGGTGGTFRPMFRVPNAATTGVVEIGSMFRVTRIS
jgi:hypothetical protein